MAVHAGTAVSQGQTPPGLPLRAIGECSDVHRCVIESRILPTRASLEFATNSEAAGAFRRNMPNHRRYHPGDMLRAAGAQDVADDFAHLLRMLDDVFAQPQAAQ